MWLATRRLGVVPQAALKRPLPAGSTLLYKRPASDMDSAVHVAKWQFRYGITGVIVGFSSAMWAVSLPPPLLGLGGAALAAQLFLGVRASTRVLEVQRARFVTQLTAHIEETQAASDREPYTSVSEGLQGTPRLNLEIETPASHYDVEVVNPRTTEEIRPRLALALKHTLAVPFPRDSLDENATFLAALLDCDKVINHEIVIPLQSDMVIPQIHLTDGQILTTKRTPLEEVRTLGLMFAMAGTAALLTGAISVGVAVIPAASIQGYFYQGSSSMPLQATASADKAT